MPPTAANPVQQSFSEPEEKPRPITPAADTKSDPSASPENRPESNSTQDNKINVLSLLGESARVAGQVGDGILKQFGIASHDEMLPPSDTASMTPVQKAAKGYERGAENETQFMEMKGPYQQKTFKEGDFKNPVKLNEKGQVTDFETTPPLDKDNGFKYSNIKYDDKGAVKSFDTPWGTTHTRVGDVNGDGYGKWQATNKQGQLVKYQ